MVNKIVVVWNGSSMDSFLSPVMVADLFSGKGNVQLGVQVLLVCIPRGGGPSDIYYLHFRCAPLTLLRQYEF